MVKFSVKTFGIRGPRG